MIMGGRDCTKDRLVHLERTVNHLNGQLRTMQSELQQTKSSPMKDRLWSSFLGPWQSGVFMSDVCNRRVRPNTKVTHKVTHDDAVHSRH